MPENDTDNSIWKKADAAFLQSTAKLIQRARNSGTPIVIWEDDTVKEISVEEFEASLQSQQPPRQFGLGKDKLTIVEEDDEPPHPNPLPAKPERGGQK